MHRQIFRLTLPNIVSNITIPLLGMVDIVIVGWYGGADLLAGIAIGGTVFNFLYWNFGFLRMGTSGFTAQAYGARDFKYATQTLFRAVSVAAVIGVMMWVLQVPIDRLSLLLVDNSSAQVKQAASDYFFMRIWAAPATLSLYAFNGWFIGMQNAKTPMWIAIIINGVNLALSSMFAFGFDMGIAGVGLGTAISQWSGVAMAVWVIWWKYRKIFKPIDFKDLYERSALSKFFQVNRDIFIRTFCMCTVYVYFTVASSSMGDDILAANNLMMQLFMIFSYMMDGFGYAGEALVGKYYGARNFKQLHKAVRYVIFWGFITSLLCTVLYALFGEYVLMIFSPSAGILASAHQYIWWAVAVPVAGFLAFLLDGFLVGLTASSIMRNGMMISAAAFFAIYWTFRGIMGNDALWLAYVGFLFIRGMIQLVMARKKLFGKVS